MSVTLITVLGCLFPFLMTVLGAATVFLFRGNRLARFTDLFLGFAAGVMLAASVWSLLNPAIAAAEARGIPGWIPAAGGMTLGVLFLLSVDVAVSRLWCDHSDASRHRVFLLQLAMTLHNIPEGMAVGLSLALAADAIPGAMISDTQLHLFYTAFALSLGIGIQNFPEGAAVTLPQTENGMSAGGAFLRGCLSGIVEPIFGVLCIVLLGGTERVMPWLLSFAAGAMLYVVCEELIPAANGNRGNGSKRISFAGTLSIMLGFVGMMILDVALG